MSIDVHFAKKTANRDLRVCAFLFIAFIAIFSLGLTGCAGVVSQAKNSDSTPIMPSITAEPTSQTVTLGQTATFAVAATGTAPMTYQWKKGGAAVSGATSSTYTTPATTSADNGTQFAVTVTNAAGSVTSNAAALTVNPGTVAPTITAQPVNESVTTGQTATFSVVATGTAPLTYQWKKSGNTISGATAASYTTPATTSADNGSIFTVMVTDGAGSTTSNAATLTVTATAVAPSITTQPTNATVTAGQTATFSVAASGTSPLTYQWKKSGTAVAGATSSSYTTPATTSGDSGTTFSVVVTNTAGSATSTAATLTVNAATVAPTITTQPVNQSVTTGKTATFSVAATGTATLTYQWKKGGTAISGATSTSYTTPATTSSDNGSQFTVVVSNTAGSATSTAATLTVTATAVAPTITTQPTSKTVTVGQTATFSVTATGTAPLTYQWKKTGTVISGATSSSYTTPATTSGDNGTTFTVVVTNAVGSATSTAATLTVNAAAVAPTITTQPVSQTVTAGQTATFSVAATGTAPLTYQWKKGGTAISGATSSSYTTPATTSSDNGSQFTVVVTNTAGSATSNAATLTVNTAAVAPTITTQPANQTVTVGQTATFSVTASGTAPLTYQWKKTGTAISGATSSSYTTPATASTDNGSTFTVVVSNATGSATSSAATLTVNPVVPPSIPAGLTATASSSSTISLNWNASTGSVAGYRVYRAGTQVGTSAVTSYLDTGLTASTNYSYTVAAYDSVGDVSGQSTSASATTLSATASCASGIPCALGWYEVPNTSLTGICPTYSDIQGDSGCAAVESAWGSALVDNTRNRLILHGGGHVDYDGNEIYAIDFNANPIAPVLVKDASHGSGVDSAVAACSEAFPDGTPNSRHDYSGLWYLPNQDVYFMYGAGIASCGNFSDGNWIYSPNAGAWTQLAPSTHPNTSQNGSIDLAAYNSTDGCLYFLENNLPAFWKQCYDSFAGANWTALAAPQGAPCDTTNASSTIDVSRQLFVCVGGGSLYTIALSSSATVNDSSASGCSAAVSAFSPGIAYDPVQQLIVFWEGGNNVLTYNATTHSCSTATFAGGPGAQLSNGTFNRFQYMPGIGAFVLANGMSSNVYTLRLTPGPSTSAADDFASRCSASGVIVCDNLSATSNLPQRTCADSDSGLYSDSCPSGTTYATVDSTTYRSGGGSALFTIPGMSGTSASGYYRRLFTANQSTVPGTNDGNLTTFGTNSDFYISYAQRMDSAFINDVATTGSSNTYWKQQIISWSGSTCGQLEITTVNDFNEGYPLAYSQCGDLPFQNTVGGTLYNEFTEPLMVNSKAGAGYNCPYGSSQPNANCFDYPSNTWVTYYYHVHVGSFGSANSLVEGFVSTPSSPAWRQWLYQNKLTINLDPGNTWGFDMVTLIPYWTGRDSETCSTPCSTAHTWYNELIVSSKPIAPPQTAPSVP